MPGPDTQYTAYICRTSQNSAATSSTSGFTGFSIVTSQISSLPALTSTSVRERPESGPDESDRDDEPLFVFDIPVSGEKG